MKNKYLRNCESVSKPTVSDYGSSIRINDSESHYHSNTYDNVRMCEEDVDSMYVKYKIKVEIIKSKYGWRVKHQRSTRAFKVFKNMLDAIEYARWKYTGTRYPVEIFVCDNKSEPTKVE